MSTSIPSFVGTYWFKLIVGVALMTFGMYGSNQGWGTPEFVQGLGLPLDLMKTVAVIGVFIILFPVIQFFYVNPLVESINNRTQSLESTFAEAEALREEMRTMQADYEKQLSQTQADAREQIQAEVKKAQDLRTQIQAEASAKADQMIKKAQEEIRAERDKALVNLRVHVAKVSMLAAEKIIGENMDTDRNRRLVDEFVDSVEVPKN